MENDIFLLKQLAKGNSIVFKRLFEAYYHPLHGFAKKFINNNDICNDIVQESFVGLWSKRKEISNPNAIKSYLYSSVRYASLNFLRNEEIKSRNCEQILILSLDCYYEDSLLEEEVHAQIYKAIKELSPQARKVIVLAMNGSKNAEIAEDLGISVNTVKTLKKRGYKFLRKSLKGISWIFLFLFA